MAKTDNQSTVWGAITSGYNWVKDGVKSLYDSSGYTESALKDIKSNIFEDNLTSPSTTGFLSPMSAQVTGQKKGQKLAVNQTESALRNLQFTDKSIEAFKTVLNSRNQAFQTTMQNAIRNSAAMSPSRLTLSVTSNTDIPAPQARPRPVRTTKTPNLRG